MCKIYFKRAGPHTTALNYMISLLVLKEVFKIIFKTTKKVGSTHPRQEKMCKIYFKRAGPHTTALVYMISLLQNFISKLHNYTDTHTHHRHTHHTPHTTHHTHNSTTLPNSKTPKKMQKKSKKLQINSK